MIRALGGLGVLLLVGCDGLFPPRICEAQTFSTTAPYALSCGLSDGGFTSGVVAFGGIDIATNPRLRSMSCTTEVDAGNVRFIVSGLNCHNVFPEENYYGDALRYTVGCPAPPPGVWQHQSGLMIYSTDAGLTCWR